LKTVQHGAPGGPDRSGALGPTDDPPPHPAPRITASQEYATFARRRRNVLVGAGAAIAVIVVALLVLASVVSKIFGNVGGAFNKDELGLNGPSSAPSTTSSASNAAPSGSMVKPTKATGFSPDADADNPCQ